MRIDCIGGYLPVGDTMKQVTNPPKTGEEFAVAFEGDGIELWKIRYNKEYQCFDREHPQLGWIPINSKQESGYFDGTMILVGER